MISITDDGLEKMSYDENLEYVEAVIKGIKGNDVDLSPSGPWGQISSILAKFLADNDDEQEEIYLSRDPDNATGVAQTKLSAETGTYRKAASNTVVEEVLLMGDEGTYIIEGSQVEQAARYEPTAGLYFSLDEDVTISRNTARKVVFSLEEVNSGVEYEVILNSVSYFYTATGSDTETTVIAALIALLPSTVSGENVDDQLSILGDEVDFTIDSNTNLTMEELWCVGNFTANLTGENYVAEETITEIVTPITGWDAVLNITAGITGEEEESDSELIIRRKNELIKGKGTDQAIKNAVTNVDNVVSAFVTSNRTMTEVDSIPAKAFETVVAGGSDDDIAQAIFDNMPAGIEPFGIGSSGNAVDDEGQEYEIPFSRTQTVYIWVRYTRTDLPEENYPDDGDTQIKTAVKKWADENVGAGNDVVRQRLGEPFFSVPGSASVNIEYAVTALPTDTPSYITTDYINVSGREKAIFDEDRIFVVTP